MKEESEWASTILADGKTAKVYYYHTNDVEVKKPLKKLLNLCMSGKCLNTLRIYPFLKMARFG